MNAVKINKKETKNNIALVTQPYWANHCIKPLFFTSIWTGIIKLGIVQFNILIGFANVNQNVKIHSGLTIKTNKTT